MKTTITKKMEVGEEVDLAAARIAVPSKMTAAVLYGSEDLRIEMIEVPRSRPMKCSSASALPSLTART